MDNELLLLSGEDIPFIEAQTVIHQPKLREISMVGERSFLSGTKFLTFTKNMLNEVDKTGLENKTDFDIIMSIICGSERIEQKNDVTLLLSLLFPTSQIKYASDGIILINNESGIIRINNLNYEVFRDILSSMFCLNEVFGEDKNYNPVGKRAEKIAAKLQAAKDKKLKKQQNGEATKVAIYSQYVSILAVGESKDINVLMNYTPYQIMDEFRRFQKKEAYDMDIRLRLAGAADLDEVDNWMENIHP